ncbi:hypothetical protein RHS04_03644 [Rhizoctonia solani]|uniref:Uncharacterized protein n=1 Tax=Rhizoctonia solani TaxID=456999 RepID=A0A8H7HED3_9AGAM|nr:hypothetical protein RHS04_03644 [Rhizoctonia solani]
MLGPPTSPIARPRPPSQSRRSSGMSAPNTPARLRTQSHTPARTHRSLLSPTDAELAPPPYSKENTQQRPNPRHSLTEIDDMLNVAGSVVRNRERVPVIDNLLFIALITTCIVELDAAALASRSLLEENKLMFAKREALLARLPISNRNSLSSTPPPERQHSNRSSSWSTCSDESDNDNSTATATPFRDMSIPLPIDPLEAHRVITPSHSASNSIDISAVVASSSPFEPPAARLAPTQAERIAALHAGLVSPPPSHPPRPRSASSRRVSVSPAAVSHLQDANAALLARVQELEDATAKAQSEGAARMRRLQAEAESLRARLGEAEKANEGLRTEAEKEKEKQRVRAQSAGPRPGRREKSIEEKEEGVKDFAPSATWRPEFRSLRGGSVRPAVPARSATTSSTVSRGPRAGGGPVRAQTSIGAPTPASTPVRAGRAQSSLSPPPTRNSPTSPLRHAPIRPSGLRHQRSNSFAGLGKSFQASLEEARRAVATIEEGATDAETGGTSPKAGVNPKLASKPSSTRSGAAAVMFPTFSDEEVKMDAEQGLDMSPSATRVLAQELVAKINELRATNEEVQQQRDNLKQMLETAQAEADDLKRVCERLEHEVEVERSGSGGGSDGETRAPRPERPGLQLNIPPLEVGEPEPSWAGSVRGRKKGGGGALLDLAAELGAELQGSSKIPSAMHMTVGLTWHRTDDKNATDAAPAVPAAVDLASELMNASMTMSKPSTPTSTVFGIAPRSRRPSISVKPPASTKRALGGRGLATRAKTNPRRVRKSLSSVVFNGGKALPSPVSSPTAADAPVTPAKNKEEAEEEFLTPRTEFVTPLMTPMNVTIHQQEVYLTPASTLRVPGGLSALAVASPVTDDEDAPEPGPSKSKEDGTMAQLRAALDPLFSGVIQGQGGLAAPQPSHAIRRKQSQLRLLLSKDEPLEPWETKIRDLYSEIKAFEQEDPGMSSAGEDTRKFSRRARALGRMSLRRRVTGAEDYASDYAADDSEVGDRVVSRRQEEEQKRLAGFQLARKFQQKSMSTFLEVLLLVQFAVVLVVFVYTAVRRGPKAVLGNKRVR